MINWTDYLVKFKTGDLYLVIKLDFKELPIF